MSKSILFSHRVNHLLSLIIDTLFPPRTEEMHVRGIKELSLDTLVHNGTHEGVHFLLPFSHTTVRSCIHEAKFYRNIKAITLLATTLAHSPHSTTLAHALWMPIPLSKKRMHERGYNQCAEILGAWEHASRPQVCIDMLTRTRHTEPQTRLSRAARLHNMEGVFAVTDPAQVHGQHIVLFDDVTTTGATLRAAKQALLPYKPASITLIALAH